MGARLGKHAGGRRVAVEERFCKPSGTFTNLRNIDGNRLRTLIQTGKLSPCYPGLEEPPPGETLEECPICFLVRAAARAPRRRHEACRRCLTTPACAGGTRLRHAAALTRAPRRAAQHYPALNRSKCCQKGLCTGACAPHVPRRVTSGLCLRRARAARSGALRAACAPMLPSTRSLRPRGLTQAPPAVAPRSRLAVAPQSASCRSRRRPTSKSPAPFARSWATPWCTAAKRRARPSAQ